MRRRSSGRSLRALGAVGCSAMLGACGLLIDPDSLRAGDRRGGGDGGDSGAAIPDAGLGEAAPSAPDAGAPPPDTACDEPWTKVTKTAPECAGRQVALVFEPGAAATLGPSVSIARTTTGRVGILYSHRSTDRDDLRLSHFVDGAEWPPPFRHVTSTRGAAWHVGDRGRLAAGAEDVLHVLLHEHPAEDPGSILGTRLIGDAAALSPREAVAEGVPNGTHLGLALAPERLHAAWYVRGPGGDGGLPGRVLTSVRPNGGVFSPAIVAVDGIERGPSGDDYSDGARRGQLSLTVDATGIAYLLVQHHRQGVSSLRYTAAAGGGQWSSPEFVDFTLAEAGLRVYEGPRLVLRGSEKVAAYFTRKEGDGTADLRIATWTLTPGSARVEVIDRAIPAERPGVPTYVLALAVDRWGLLHLAVVRPEGARDRGSLWYVRQSRTPDGTIWLRDTVDDAVLWDTDDASVDIVVDERGRPHIAYRSGKANAVYYATKRAP